MKAIVFSAGLGTRLKQETSGKPKALVEIGGKPLLAHVIGKLKREGISDVVVNVHHFANQIIDYVNQNDFGLPVRISDETSKLLDTGGALKKAAPLLQSKGEPVLMYNVDVLSTISIADLQNEHEQSGALATLAVRSRETQRYFKFGPDKRLVGWINKTTGEKKVSVSEGFEDAVEMAFSGIHIASPKIFDLLPENDYFSMTSLYLNLANNHLIRGYFDPSDLWMDVGKPEELKKARRLYQ
ncbi:MAG: nucleotidyltransferase family protein [Mariniphaga sp.]